MKAAAGTVSEKEAGRIHAGHKKAKMLPNGFSGGSRYGNPTILVKQ